jgi:hypothetical protein
VPAQAGTTVSPAYPHRETEITDARLRGHDSFYFPLKIACTKSRYSRICFGSGCCGTDHRHVRKISLVFVELAAKARA